MIDLHTVFVLEQCINGLLRQILIGTSRGSFMLLYMGFGTSIVMGIFGFMVGRKDFQLIKEQQRMSETYKLFLAKEEMFEQRLFTLHNRMNGITHVSASIQRSGKMDEVFQLCADGICSIQIIHLPPSSYTML